MRQRGRVGACVIAARRMLDSEVTASRIIRIKTMMAEHAEEENGTGGGFEFMDA